MSKKLKMHVISGTHWDREWRFTAEQSKVRLVDLIDSIIDILESRDDFKYFMMDGGVIIIEDYLSVRPEKKDKLINLIKKGKLIFVPWYTLPDMFLVDSESIVRNLLIGKREGEKYGGTLNNAYTATSYGQPSQMPQLISGFGMEAMLFYRGLNKHVVPPVFKWKSPDGSQIIVVRGFDEFTRTNFFFYAYYPTILNKEPADLSYYFNVNEKPVHMADPELYEFDFRTMNEDFSLPDEEERYKRGFDFLFNHTFNNKFKNHLLALNMEDNQKPFINLPQLLKKYSEIAQEKGLNLEIIQTTFDKYIEEIKKDISDEYLPVLEGEMRNTVVEPGFNGLLGAVTSSRINLKLLNDKAETKLIYFAEPLSAFAELLGKEYPSTIINLAWKSLLANQAHDSICGAAIDQAHKDMLFRFSNVIQVSDEITRRSIEYIWNNINTSAFNLKEDDFTITVINTSLWRREEIVEAIIDIPESYLKGAISKADVAGNFGKVDVYFDLIDENNQKIPYKIIRKEKVNMRVERELDTAVRFEVIRHRILFKAVVPPLGYKTYGIKFRDPEYIKIPETIFSRRIIARDNGILENEYILININCNGTFDVLDKINQKKYSNLHYFVDNGEIGNAHFTTKPIHDFTVTSLGSNARIIKEEANEFRGTYRVETYIKIPFSANKNGDERIRDWIVEIPIIYWITLNQGSNKVNIKLKVDNRARDHRLKVMFPTKINTDKVYVESVFKIEERNILWKDVKDNSEEYLPYMPMKNFVDINDENVGFTFLSKGLREYEVIDDKERTVAITLLRTQRAYMTANSTMNWEELNKYTGSHVIGTLEYEYSLLFHKGNTFEANVIKEAYINKMPLKLIQGVNNKEGKLKGEGSFFQIYPDTLVYSAIKKSESGDGFVIRIWNPTNNEIDAVVQIGQIGIKDKVIKKVKKVRLDEKEIEELLIKDQRVKLKIKAWEIVSVKIEV